MAATIAHLDASKLKITLTDTLGVIPDPETLVFGQTTTDHMLTMAYNPSTGWSPPEIKPYGPLVLDPKSSCFQYATNVFEGMKAYIGQDGKTRLFRPNLNMARLARSVARVALPPFDTDQLLILIKKLVEVDARWIPTLRGYSLYIRPTILGTRPALGVGRSDESLIYVILSPTGPYFRAKKPSLSTALSPAAPPEIPIGTIALLATGTHVRAWPGGTGAHKLALNYSPGFVPQIAANSAGYDQILWLLPDDSDKSGKKDKVTEAGAMNFFVVIQRDDGGSTIDVLVCTDLDIITPPLDGTILPGVTRASCLALLKAHADAVKEGNPKTTAILPGIDVTLKLHITERTIYMGDLVRWHADGVLKEAFCVGTAVVVAGIGKIGYHGEDKTVKDLEFATGLGPFARALCERIVGIQEGRIEWEDWSAVC